LRVQRDGRSVKVAVKADGTGLVSHAGSALLAGIADRLGLTTALSREVGQVRQRQGGHDPGRVLRDLAVTLADGGVSLSDLAVVRNQEILFGKVASDSTAYRVLDAVAADPQLMAGVRAAHARARAVAWELIGVPEKLAIDIDATLLTAHSNKQAAAGNYKRGFGFHPLMAYADQTGEALAGILRPGNAGSNTAEDHLVVLDEALAQVPEGHIELIEITLRADGAGATHELLAGCRERRVSFSVGYELTPAVTAAISTLPETAWTAAIHRDGTPRGNGQVAEITHLLNLTSWPERSRVIIRRERPRPGSQLSFTDIDGHRFQAILTDNEHPMIEVIEAYHRQHAHVEDHIRVDKDTGLEKLPFQNFAINELWLYLVMLAHDLLAWTRALLLSGDLAKAEPRTLRYRLLHTAARLAFTARGAILHLPSTWPWATQLTAAFTRLAALPAPTG
jgi:hypothetical protein